jgi:hypothetical protein
MAHGLGGFGKIMRSRRSSAGADALDGPALG